MAQRYSARIITKVMGTGGITRLATVLAYPGIRKDLGQRMILPPGSGWETHFFIDREENGGSKAKNPTVFARIRKDFEVWVPSEGIRRKSKIPGFQ